MATLTELKCPYCQKALKSEEYEEAIKVFKQKAEQEYKELQNKERDRFQNIIEEIRKQHQIELASLQETIQSQIKRKYESQLKEIQSEYEIKGIQKLKELEYSWNRKTTNLESELREKDKQYQELQAHLTHLKTEAILEAREKIQGEIDLERQKVIQKEIQLRRAQEEADKLKRQLSETQSELIGEVGELDLLDKLKKSFPNDLIERTSRGTESGDIIHRIKLPTGSILHTTIIYDNKNVNVVTKRDIKKAKGYMQLHETEHIIIVSRNLPRKDIRNGLYGESDGVLLVHPSILIEVVEQIRKEIIKISKFNASRNKETSKQSKLYNYIRSSEFNRLLESIIHIHETKVKIQNDEEKQHRAIWKRRRDLDDQLRRTYFEITAGIDSITQEYIEQKINENS